MRFIVVIKVIILVTLTCCSSDTQNNIENKRFIEPDNTVVFTTKFVVIDKRGITTVTHEKEDGASNDQFDNFEDVAKIVGLGEIIKLDSTLLEIADLPVEFTAQRRFKGEKWVIKESR